ncbi:MAG: shikimate kinase [Candidatus Latescibacteria bacterium]|nr:shikimate kinase [Candidatus Latescibacterota bacterium]
MKIVLVGYRAAGKSTVAELVARQLGWPCLEVDRRIEERCGRSIVQFYQEEGDLAYRDLETAVVEEYCAGDRCIVSFGAGSLMRPQNQAAAQRDSLVVYLQTTPQELWRRIEGDPSSASTRPNLSGGGLEEVEEMLAAREPVYRQCANLVIDATRPPEELARAIVVALQD